MAKEKAIFGAGCFWHVQKVFDDISGVISTTVGYTGGRFPNPTYEEVSSGKSGHVEAIEIIFDDKIVSYEDLLNIFWTIHDPTTKDRQGADIGSNYCSTIFFTSGRQKKIANITKQQQQKLLHKKIVTMIKKSSYFYPAESYHQKYYEKNKVYNCVR